MNKKIRKVALMLPIIILFSITLNFIQKTVIDNQHTHYEHNSIVHIHEHTHTNNNTHSHNHSSSNNITFLDHFVFSNENIYLGSQKNNQSFELLTFYQKDLINSLFKPPIFS